MRVTIGNIEVDSESTGRPRLGLTDLKGWYSSPAVRTDAPEIPLADGAFAPIRSYRSARRMMLEGFAVGSSAEAVVAEVYQKVAALFPQGDSEVMEVEDATGVKTARVWLDGGPQVIPFSPTAARFQVPLVAPDPRKYSLPTIEEATPSGGAEDGMTYPLFNSGFLSFGEFSPAGLFFITNGGTAETWPVFAVRGGIDASGFEIRSGDQALVYSAAVLSGTEVLLSPYAGGRASIAGADVTANLTQADWPSILPGQTRQYVFSALGTADANALLTTTVSKAWW